MWLKSRNSIFLFILFIASLIQSSRVTAQGLGNSPYSVLGVGELYSDAFASTQGAGGAGVSYANGFNINNLNPALWSRTRETMFEFGVIGQYKEAQASNGSQRDLGGNIAYLGLAFPVAKNWVSGFTLKPYSYVDFENRYTSKVPGTNYDALYTTNGKGAINQASFVNGFRIGKYFSAGVEASFLFGNVTRATNAQMAFSTDGNFVVSKKEKTNYSDILLKGGATAMLPLKKDNKLNLHLGGTYTLGNDVNSTKTSTFELTKNSYAVGVPDTLVSNRGRSLYLPQQFRIGTTLSAPYHWNVSVDYQYQAWGEYKNRQDDNVSKMRNVGRIHVGGEYIPRITSTRYFDLVTYRVGFSHGKMPYLISGVDLQDTNVSLGFSLPIGGFANSLNIAIVGGQRGVISRNSVKEQYGKFVLGFTFADRWFQKMKVD